MDFEGKITDKMITDFSLTKGEALSGKEPTEIGADFADGVIHLGSNDSTEDVQKFGEDAEANMNLASAVYERVQAGVPA